MPLSELVTSQASNVALDLNDTIDQNNQALLETSFTVLDHANETHTPFYNIPSLAQSIGTDARGLRKALAEADEGEVKWKNKVPYMAQGCTLEFLYERLEQPRDSSQQALIESTIDTVNLANDLSYTGIIEQIENALDASLMQENEFMDESSKIALIAGSQTVVSHDGDGENPITALQVQTDTQVVNYRLYMDASILHEVTGLSKSEVREHLASAPQDKIATLNNQTFDRLPVIKWNQTSLQNRDPDVRARGQVFQSSAHSLITEPVATKARAISAASVTKNPTKLRKRNVEN